MDREIVLTAVSAESLTNNFATSSGSGGAATEMVNKKLLAEALAGLPGGGGGGGGGSTSSGGGGGEDLGALRARVKAEVLRSRLELLVDDVTLMDLADRLRSQPSLSYDEYVELSRGEDSVVPAGMRRFVSSPSVFLTLTRNDSGRILTEDLLHFVQRSMDVESTLLHLLRFASNGLSAGCFITEQELERYLFKLIPEISGHESISRAFYPYYVFTAARRFFFFLDPKRTRRINIKKLGHSTVMEELLYLKRLSQVQNAVDPSQVATNWFSGQNALKLYSLFLELDRNKTGCLSVDDMLQFPGTPDEAAQLTRIALERIFEANVAYSPLEMDYKTFLDLCLAIENKTTVESLTYFWRAVDLEHTGRLGPDTIKLLYRGVYDALRGVNYDAPSPENVVVEVFDLLGCNDPRGPTFGELVKSGQGHVVFSMLLDCGGFWNYDNRESLMQHNNNNNNNNNNSGGGGGGGGVGGSAPQDDDDDDYF